MGRPGRLERLLTAGHSARPDRNVTCAMMPSPYCRGLPRICAAADGEGAGARVPKVTYVAPNAHCW